MSTCSKLNIVRIISERSMFKLIITYFRAKRILLNFINCIFFTKYTNASTFKYS